MLEKCSRLTSDRLTMGSSDSKVVKKVESPLTTSSENKPDAKHYDCFKSATPYVLSRKGSMYMDEDGDLAHEFYIEDPPQKSGTKATMKRIFTNLTPQVVHEHFAVTTKKQLSLIKVLDSTTMLRVVENMGIVMNQPVPSFAGRSGLSVS